MDAKQRADLFGNVSFVSVTRFRCHVMWINRRTVSKPNVYRYEQMIRSNKGGENLTHLLLPPWLRRRLSDRCWRHQPTNSSMDFSFFFFLVCWNYYCKINKNNQINAAYLFIYLLRKHYLKKLNLLVSIYLYVFIILNGSPAFFLLFYLLFLSLFMFIFIMGLLLLLYYTILYYNHF